MYFFLSLIASVLRRRINFTTKGLSRRYKVCLRQQWNRLQRTCPRTQFLSIPENCLCPNPCTISRFHLRRAEGRSTSNSCPCPFIVHSVYHVLFSPFAKSVLTSVFSTSMYGPILFEKTPMHGHPRTVVVWIQDHKNGKACWLVMKQYPGTHSVYGTFFMLLP